MSRRRTKSGQVTLETAVLFAIVGAALIAMTIYMNRGVQGKLKSSTDEVGEQYSAGETTGKITQKSSSDTHESVQQGVTVNTINLQEDSVTGDETVTAFK